VGRALPSPSRHLPIAVRTTLGHLSSVPGASRSLQDQDALVIEDDPDARRLVAACLRRLGMRVQESETAAQAFTLLECGAPDLICLDLRLPDASGFALCERIRATPSLRDVPILVITALARPIDRAQAEAAGADGYLLKPFRADAFADSVLELMALSSIAPS
jgi:CheY-like chemotaxis protein